MSFQQRDLFVKHIFSTVAPYIDLLTRGFSLGLDHFWRVKAVAHSEIGPGAKVLDICAGTGELAALLARKVGPGGSVIGADFCEEMLVLARKKTGSRYPNLTYILADAKQVPFSDSTFDAVTVAFGMRNIPDTTLALQEIKRVLKPGGKFICLELTKPHVRWFGLIYEWYVFRVMPFIAELVVKEAAPFLYLPRSIKAYYPPEEFRRIIGEAGFSDVAVDSMTMGAATIYRAVNRG